MISRPPQIRPTHLLRLAVAYVRQSSPRQVLENFASADLQRELVGYLRAWGWRDEQIVVLDCDLGFSASVAGQRGGLFWLIDQCEQDRVGIVMVLEDNRLSRNRPDFVAFSEVARVHDVLWATQQQVFDLNDPHSEFVSSIMQDSAVLKSKLLFYNLREGKVRKARKGVSATAPPVGYVRQRSGAWTKHPDAAVRDVITRVFEKIFELGTGRSVVRYFRRNGDKLPRQGRAGQIRWVDATLGIVGLMFHNEAYAGTYVFRKRIVDPRLPRLKNGHHRTRRTTAAEQIRIEDHHEPYISPARFAELQERLRANLPQKSARRPPGKGSALLQGLLCCAIHQVTLTPTYMHRERLADGREVRGARYQCRWFHESCSTGSCLNIRGKWIDAFIEAEVLNNLAPPSIEMLQRVARDGMTQYEAMVRARQAERHRAESAVAELERQFCAEPEEHVHRRRWLATRAEEAHRAKAELEEVHRRVPLVPPVQFAEAEVAELTKLITDLRALWRHASITPLQRKRVLRVIIKRIYVTPGSDAYGIETEWTSGARTALRLVRQAAVDAAVVEGAKNGDGPAQIASRVNEVGARTRHKVGPFTPPGIRKIASRLGVQLRTTDPAAYPYIHRRSREGAFHNEVAQELNQLGIQHRLGQWTRCRVISAVQMLRRGSVEGLEPLVPQRRTWTGPADRDATLRVWWAETPRPVELARRANHAGLLTRQGNEWTPGVMARKLADLGLWTPRTRRAKADPTPSNKPGAS